MNKNMNNHNIGYNFTINIINVNNENHKFIHPAYKH